MNIIIDTGPLVAFFDRSDQYHYQVGKEFARLEPPFHTCEAVVTETVFLLLRGKINPGLLFEMVERGDLVIKPVLNKIRCKKEFGKLWLATKTFRPRLPMPAWWP